MKMQCIIVVLCLTVCGCNNEPATPRGEAEQAQENFEEARIQAAEVIAESEEDAVEIVADAREEANNIVADAKEELTEKLDELSQARKLESQPNEKTQRTSP